MTEAKQQEVARVVVEKHRHAGEVYKKGDEIPCAKKAKEKMKKIGVAE